MILFYLICVIYLAAVRSQGSCDNGWRNNPDYYTQAERVYYIGCVEEKWDYAPSGKNVLSGETISDGSGAGIWLFGNGADRIGSEYIKALYREFTNACFTTQKVRSEDEKHLGALGPNIRALTGERIKIFYQNQCSFTTSIHVHGLKYHKSSEGAPYNDNTTTKGDDIVAANGGKWIYVYDTRTVNSDHASSKLWLYHSHVDEPRDISTGLFGAVIITKKGFETSLTNLMPRDIDREFTTFMVLYDENESELFDLNLNEYLANPGLIDLADEDFIEANLMHAINGYLFGNLAGLNCVTGEKVRWYTAAFGNEGDGPHSPHWHGNIAVDPTGESIDTLILIPGTTLTVTMLIDEPGSWLYHCHVHDHINAGMAAIYTARPPDNVGGLFDGKYCCRGKLEPNTNGRCWGITDENECNVAYYKWCEWDQWNCQVAINCDLRGGQCAGMGNNNCCSGYCNQYGKCS